MDLRKIKTILELFENSNVAELEISEGESKVRIKRLESGTRIATAVVGSASAVELPAPESAPAVDPVDEANLVKAPMVGTFYRSSDPESKPFAEVGDSVAVGQTLCIIEAMKLMNEIPAPYAGVVRSVAASNGEAVGFGDPLFVIERA